MAWLAEFGASALASGGRFLEYLGIIAPEDAGVVTGVARAALASSGSAAESSGFNANTSVGSGADAAAAAAADVLGSAMATAGSSEGEGAEDTGRPVGRPALVTFGLGNTGIDEESTVVTPMSPETDLSSHGVTSEHVGELKQRGINISAEDLALACQVLGKKPEELVALPKFNATREGFGGHPNYARGLHWRTCYLVQGETTTSYLALDVTRVQEENGRDGAGHGRVLLHMERHQVQVSGESRLRLHPGKRTDDLTVSAGSHKSARHESVPYFGQDEGPVFSGADSNGSLDRFQQLTLNMTLLLEGLEVTDDRERVWRLAEGRGTSTTF